MVIPSSIRPVRERRRRRDRLYKHGMADQVGWRE